MFTKNSVSNPMPFFLRRAVLKSYYRLFAGSIAMLQPGVELLEYGEI
jgi:hypothetical protein